MTPTCPIPVAASTVPDDTSTEKAARRAVSCEAKVPIAPNAIVANPPINSQVLPKPETMREGDVLIGVASSGVHSNGYSLVRKVVAMTGMSLSSPAPFTGNATMGDALLTPTRLYVKSALAAIRSGGIKGLAHITGGGVTENLPRVLPTKLDAEINLDMRCHPFLHFVRRRQCGPNLFDGRGDIKSVFQAGCVRCGV